MFFEGSVAEAIAASRREVKPLVVLLTGVGSREVQDALLSLRQEAFSTGCIVLALEDDLGDSDPSAFQDAKHFRAFCPVEQLPAVVMVSPAGAVLTKAAGAGQPEELRNTLAAAYDAFVQQQARLMAAQAALMAMAAGGGGGAPASAAVEASAAGEARVGGGVRAPEAEAAEQAAPTAAPSGREEAPQVEQPSSPAVELPNSAAAPAAAQPDVAAQPFRLQFKFTDGAVLLGDFTGGTPLADVFAWIDERRAAAGACRGLAYVLVQAAPRLVLGAAQEGLALAAAGLAPRTSLQVIPHAALGHRPPVPPAVDAGQGPAGAAAGAADAAQQQRQLEEGAQGPPQGATQPAAAAADLHAQLREARAAAAAAQQQQQQQGRDQRRQAATAAARAEAAAGPPPPPPPPAEIHLQVRLSNGDSLRAAFPSDSRLAAVYDWLDAERTDRGPYRLYQSFPRRVFYAGDLDSTLLELGFGARTALQLDLLPPRGKAGAPAPPTASTPAAAGSGEPPSAAAQAAAAATAVPGDFVLQFKLTDGGQLRASFPPEATLQQVVHHLDAHRTDGGAPYALVQPLPKRRFAPEDLPLPLCQLGLQQRQLLLLEPLSGSGGNGGGGWSLRGTLAAVAGYLNPYAYLRGGPAGTAREQQEAASAVAAPSSTAAAEQPASGGTRTAAATTRKRVHGGASANIHTLSGAGGSAGDGDEEERDPGGNSYWNGNSTQFGAPPPPEDR